MTVKNLWDSLNIVYVYIIILLITITFNNMVLSVCTIEMACFNQLLPRGNVMPLQNGMVFMLIGDVLHMM